MSIEVIKSGGHITGARLSNAQRKAMDMEIMKGLARFNRLHSLEIEALVMRQVRRRLDLDEAQLREFYDSFADDLKALTDYYEMGDEDQAWLCVYELQQEGIDIPEWHKEKWPNEKFEWVDQSESSAAGSL